VQTGEHDEAAARAEVPGPWGDAGVGGLDGLRPARSGCSGGRGDLVVMAERGLRPLWLPGTASALPCGGAGKRYPMGSAERRSQPALGPPARGSPWRQSCAAAATVDGGCEGPGAKTRSRTGAPSMRDVTRRSATGYV
jgi:hypothetical protein